MTEPSISSSSHLDRAYREARQAGCLWHEFGDSHLIIGGPSPGSERGQSGV